MHARLAWGYVAYPPLTPFVARLALDLFGPSLVGLRLFSAAAQCAAMVLTGLIARELGGQSLGASRRGAGGGQRADFADTGSVVPVRLVRLSLVGADRVLQSPPAELGQSALVARHRRGSGPRAADAGTRSPSCWQGWPRVCCSPPARRWLTSRWLWGGVALAMLDLAAEPAVAGATRVHLVGVPERDPRARHRARPDAGVICRSSCTSAPTR